MQVRKACRVEDELEPGTCAVMCDFISDGKKSPCGEVPGLGPPWGGSRLLSGSERARLRAGGQVAWLACLPWPPGRLGYAYAAHGPGPSVKTAVTRWQALRVDGFTEPARVCRTHPVEQPPSDRFLLSQKVKYRGFGLGKDGS